MKNNTTDNLYSVMFHPKNSLGIIQAGIKRVVYSEKYRLEDGLDLLKRANIEVIYINPNE